MKNIFLLLVLFLFLSCAKHEPSESQSPKSISEDALKDKILQSYPNISIGDIQKIDDNLFEILINKQIYYATSDGKFLIVGNIIDLDTKESITENTKMKQRVKIVNSINDSNMIIYKPNETKYILTIFTDSSCPYCQKLHNEIDDLVKNDIEVRYILFSRNGAEVEAYKQLVSAWCAEDRLEAIESIFLGDLLDENLTCDNPINENYEFASTLSVEGTPTIFLQDGRIIPGYQNHQDIMAFIYK